MLTPFTALLPVDSDVEHWALERAAKALRRDPASYQSVEGVEYDATPPSLYRWEIDFAGRHVEGLVGLFPLTSLLPHEATKPDAIARPQHPVQIRPVMALVDESLPDTTPLGETVHFHGRHHHSVTPVAAVEFDPIRAIIADGHHRVAAAIRTGEHPQIMTMLVDSSTPLDVGAFHRVFPGSARLPSRIPGCDVVPEPPRESVHERHICVVTPEGSIGVTITDGVADPVLSGLPAGLAARFVLPALGLDEGQAAYVDDIRTALAAVDEGSTAVILPPSRVSAVMEAAEARLPLPPKSTRFRPKPIRGLLMRPLPSSVG